MEKREIRTLFTETLFTGLCKNGFTRHQSKISGTYDVRFTKIDIKHLCEGKIIEKDVDDAILKFALQDLGLDLIREIVRRSPIYSELAQEI
jgi:hypothetical protein